MHSYIVNTKKTVISNSKNQIISSEKIKDAVLKCNEILANLQDSFEEYSFDLFKLLGLRNLSGLVGEIFVSAMEITMMGDLTKNPHQDGYPDLLSTMTKVQKKYYKTLLIGENNTQRPISKEVFSPFRFGGFEVKATCGNTPPAKKIPKPLVGESRIDILTSFEWKAHHRSTNDLIALLWDFIDTTPVIVSVFFMNNLTQDDWGEVVKPKGDSRATSVSIMPKSAVKKMCANWVVFLNKEKYIDKLANKKWIGYRIK